MGLGAVNIDLGSIGTGVKDIAGGVGSLLKDIRAAITGKAILDPTKLAELEAKALELEQQAMNAQVEIDKLEAASPSMFKSGWRPGAGWLCVFGLAWATFIVPFWIWAAAIFKLPLPPNIDTGVLISLLVALLGLGGYRTYEKTRNGK